MKINLFNGDSIYAIRIVFTRNGSELEYTDSNGDVYLLATSVVVDIERA